MQLKNLLMHCSIVVIILPSMAWSTVRHVPSTYASIQAGINAAASGDTVEIAPGIYSGSGNSNLTCNKSILVRGRGGADSVFVDCAGTDGFASLSAGAEIRGLTVRNGNTGIKCGNATIDSVVLQANSTYGLLITLGAFPQLYANTYMGNGVGKALTGGDCVTSKTLRPDSQEPYIVLNDITVWNNATLTLEPGVSLAFASGAGMRIGKDLSKGELVAEGTVTDRITFTSQSGSSGDWDGLYFDMGSNTTGGVGSSLSFCVVENAGQSGWGIPANIYCKSTNQPHIINSVVRNSSAAGISCNGSNPTVDTDTIQHNGTFGLFIDGSTTTGSLPLPTLSGNVFGGNRYGIGLRGYSISTNWTLPNTGADTNRVLSDLYLHSQLTIEPGTKILFDSDAGLQVADGVLTAVGSQTDSILFSSTNGSINGWDGLYFQMYSDDSGRVSDLSHCIIEKAGQMGWGQSANVYSGFTTQPVLNHSTIRLSAGSGVFVLAAAPTIDSCRIVDNTVHGITLGGNGYPNNFDNEYSGNLLDLAMIGGSASPHPPCILHKDSPPYTVLSDIDVASDSLTIQPGVTMKFMSNTGLNVYRSTLHAVGTSENPITFTSFSGMPGGWKGIKFDEELSNYPAILEHCIVSYAGETGWGQAANLFFNSSSNVLVRNCKIVGSSGYGAYIYSSGPRILSSEIGDHSLDGIFANSYGSIPEIGNVPDSGCTFFRNSGYHIYNAGSLYNAGTVNARYNFWGETDSAAIASRIFDKDDDNARGRVFFMPFSLHAHDAQVLDIIRPDSIEYYPSEIVPRALVRNIGENSDTVPVIMEIGSLYRDSVAVVLDPGDSATVEFLPWTIDQIGTVDVAAVAMLPGDGFVHNDTAKLLLAVAQDSLGPVIFSISPRTYGNSGSLPLVVQGSRFQPGSLVKLTRDSTVVYAESLRTVVSDSTELRAEIPMDGVAPGSWDVVVRTPEGKLAVAHDALEVAPTVNRLWATISGSTTLRVGRHQTYRITFGNYGNTVARSCLLLFSYPELLDAVVTYPQSTDSFRISADSLGLYPDSSNLLQINVGDLEPGETGFVNCDLYVNNPMFARREMQLTITRVEAVFGVGEHPAAEPGTMMGSAFPKAIEQQVELRVTIENAVGFIIDFTDPNPKHWVVGTIRHPYFHMNGYVYTFDPQTRGAGKILRMTEAQFDNWKSSRRSGGTAVWLNDTKTLIVNPVMWGQNVQYIESRITIQHEAYENFYNLTNAFYLSDGRVQGNYDCILGWEPFAVKAGVPQGFVSDVYEVSSPSAADAFLRTCGIDPVAEGLYGGWHMDLYFPNRVKKLTPSELATIVGWKGSQAAYLIRLAFPFRITNSGDPNDKSQPPGYDTIAHFVDGGDPYVYNIYFENVDSATASADSIWITDTLDADLDWSTFEFGDVFPGAGPDTIRPDLSVTRNFDPSTGVASWELFNINLPPDTVPYWGEGWVSYSVKPKAGLASGTQIRNWAWIKFDNNYPLRAPMDTNGVSRYVMNTIDAEAPQSTVLALPDTTRALQFHIDWSGMDETGGCGIASYSVYYRDNGGILTLWLSDTADTSATFTGQKFHRYDFYCTARDNVGHSEILSSVPDASTFLIPCCSNLTGNVDCDPIDGVDISDLSTLIDYLYISFTPLCCTEEANVDGQPGIDISDLSALIDYLYISFTPPAVCQ